MGVFKFEHEESSRGWNYRQLSLNLRSKKRRQAVSKISKKDKGNLTEHKIDDDIREIIEMYFNDKSLEEAINSVKSNNKGIMDELILIKNSWDNLKIIKGDLK